MLKFRYNRIVGGKAVCRVTCFPPLVEVQFGNDVILAIRENYFHITVVFSFTT